MRVLLGESMFVGATDWTLSLFVFGLLGRHRVLPNPSAVPSYERWLQGREPDVREWVELAVDGAVHEEASGVAHHELRVSRTPLAGEVSPGAALALLQRPYRVLLEDGISDRDFLLRMCRPLERAYLHNRIEAEWVEMEHGGGVSRMPKRVEEIARKGEPSLVSVLSDSDAKSRGAPSIDAESLRKKCRDHGVHHHQLARRAIENYLPRSALERWCARGSTATQQLDRRARVCQVFGLPDDQRHFVNFKMQLDDGRVGALFGDDTAMNDADIASEGGPAELEVFVRELVARTR